MAKALISHSLVFFLSFFFFACGADQSSLPGQLEVQVDGKGHSLLFLQNQDGKRVQILSDPSASLSLRPGHEGSQLKVRNEKFNFTLDEPGVAKLLEFSSEMEKEEITEILISAEENNQNVHLIIRRINHELQLGIKTILAPCSEAEVKEICSPKYSRYGLPKENQILQSFGVCLTHKEKRIVEYEASFELQIEFLSPERVLLGRFSASPAAVTSWEPASPSRDFNPAGSCQRINPYQDRFKGPSTPQAEGEESPKNPWQDRAKELQGDALKNHGGWMSF
jgi:hypothetical protein